MTSGAHNDGGAATILSLAERCEAATGADHCWKWPRKVDQKGRGRIWVNGRLMLAHRAMWEAINGPIPEGKMLCHHCDNAGCVNPRHMYVGTHRDNMRDMKERKRYFAANEPERVAEIGRKLGLSNTWTKGADNPKAKLTFEQAAQISADKRCTKQLAATYGVDRTTIQRIRSGKHWHDAILKARAETESSHEHD